MFKSALLAALILLAAPLFALGSQPPVSESLDLTLLTLNRLRLEAPRGFQPGLLPAKSKALPSSVRAYLKSTPQIDILNRVVEKAAAQVARAVAPGARQKDKLRDSRLVARALAPWLDGHLALDPSIDWAARSGTDIRKAYPRVSEILKEGKSDADGRALAAVALLRALKVPARVAMARGGLVAQYWVALRTQPQAPEARAAGRRGATRARGAYRRAAAPQGWWECTDPGVLDCEIDAWSLDASSLERVRWKRRQGMSVAQVGWERAVFGEGDSRAALAAYSAGVALGVLSGTAQAQPLSAAATAAFQDLTRGTATLWVLTAQHWRLRVEGAMAGMDHVQILTPYRPDFQSWGREQPLGVRASEIEAQGVWSDRPQRLRLHKDLQDVWESPPPALGMLHWYDLGVRRHDTVLQASRRSGRVEGVLLRCDNLSPRQGWEVQASGQGLTPSVKAQTGPDGHFVLPLDGPLDAAEQLEVSSPGSGDDGDSQRLPRPLQ